MSHAPTLEPFIDVGDDIADGDEFVSGFRDRAGERCGVAVPLPRASLERLILLTETFEPWMDFDGSVQCRPMEADEELYGAMLTAENVLPRVAVDDLVTDMIDGHRNEPSEGEDGVLEPFRKLRSRLQNALDFIDAEIDRRVSLDPVG